MSAQLESAQDNIVAAMKHLDVLGEHPSPGHLAHMQAHIAIAQVQATLALIDAMKPRDIIIDAMKSATQHWCRNVYPFGKDGEPVLRCALTGGHILPHRNGETTWGIDTPPRITIDEDPIAYKECGILIGSNRCNLPQSHDRPHAHLLDRSVLCLDIGTPTWPPCALAKGHAGLHSTVGHSWGTTDMLKCKLPDRHFSGCLCAVPRCGAAWGTAKAVHYCVLVAGHDGDCSADGLFWPKAQVAT